VYNIHTYITNTHTHIHTYIHTQGAGRTRGEEQTAGEAGWAGTRHVVEEGWADTGHGVLST